MKEKWKQLPVSVRAALVFGICSFLSSGISFLLMPIFTRIMSKEQYGIVTDYNSWHYIIEVFAVLGLASVGSFNVGLNEYRDRRDRFVSSMLIMANLATLAVFAFIFVIKGIAVNNFILSWPLLICMFIGFLFSPATTFFLARKRYEYKYRTGAIVTIGSIIAIQGLAVILVLIFGEGPAETTETVTTVSEISTTSSTLGESIVSTVSQTSLGLQSSEWKVIGTLIGTLIFGIPLYLCQMKRGLVNKDNDTAIGIGTTAASESTHTTLQMMKEMFVFTLPLLPHYLALHVMNGADRIMVGKLDSVSSEAVYGVASSLGLAAATVWTAINGSLQPYIFGKLNDGDTASVRKTTKYLLAFYAGLCVVVSLMAPELLMILAPAKYSDGLAAIPPIIGMAFLNALYNVYASIEFYHKKSVGIAVATIVSAGLNIGLNAWLIPIYGLPAAAYTTLIANAVLTFCHYIGYRLADKRKIFSDLTFLVMSVACIAACLASSLLYDTIWVRYVIIVVIAIVIIIKREILLKFLKLK